ncbi:putative peptidyl-tRNA hydrolase PTRHD1 [Octopus sinensis]|uniref:peptidyl-tRNA hydrolase n=1 Tax=Octopus sinensis TaxID=2607531 RepID=A0A6P7TLV7_9MOLL|nr:putative peptidyl-tRNA hydrolase PTRHD1 [Octopus sinensis]
MAGVIVQYIVVRKDLLEKLSWPLGAVIAQACHACSAVLHQHQDDAGCKEYLEKIDSMHKVILQIPDEEKLRQLSSTLLSNNIDHKLWIEQPENIATCLATKPDQKETIQKYFKNLKLFK